MSAHPGEPLWMKTLRSQAADAFQSMPWPTPAEEEWRRTDVSKLALDAYAPAPAVGEAPPAEEEGVPDGTAGLIRFVEGRCVEVRLQPALAEKGVRILPLALALEEFETPLFKLWTSAIQEADNRLVAWHYAAWRHGAFLWVPAGLEIREPFFVDFSESGAAGSGAAGGLLTSPHVTVILGENARAAVVQRIGEKEPGTRLLCNAAADMSLADGAGLRFFEAQDLGERSLYFRNSRAWTGRDASLRHVDAAFGARLVKTRLEATLSGKGSEAYLDGVYYCRGGQHMDIRTVQNHRSANATSRAYYKGAVAGGGRTVFQGLIEVGEGASGTDAFLTNRNLILGEGARSDSIPTLRIGNNDVKCSHGSTTGRLNAEELFYLESRGLSEHDAREMLVVGYFEDLLATSPEGFRDTAIERIRQRLRAAAEQRTTGVAA
jgi:Fe-S cluster assembly protein SufD